MRIDPRQSGIGVLAALVVGIGVGGMLAGSPGVQAQQQTQPAGASAEQLRYRLDTLDAELAAIRAQMGGGPSASTGGAAAALSGSALTDLDGEVRRLTAMVEELQNRQRRIAEEAARRFSDIEFRLTELEGGDTAGLQPVPPLGGVGTDLGAGPGTGQGNGQGNGQASGQGAGGQASQQRGQLAAVSIAEQGDLDRAADDVRQGRYDQAEERLHKFLHDYPASSLTGDAWYFLGESQLVRGNTGEAARSYLKGYNADRTGSRAPYNLYRLGVSLGRLGQVNEACLTLHEVGAQFPSAPDNLVDKADAEAHSLSCG